MSSKSLKGPHLFRPFAMASALALSTALPGAAEAATPPPAASKKIDQARLAGLPQFIDGVLAQQLSSSEVAGAVVSVVHGGKIVFSRGYGFADVDRGIPADPQRSLFRPGSSSKLFTWTALMQLVEQGRVDLNADVNQYLDFKIPNTQSRPILVRHLLDHTLGFEDRGGIRVDSPSEFVPLGTWLAKNIPTRVREPGVETSYSNYGTALAGYIVQRVSGEPFPDYVERHIFKPLGMNRTTFREPLPPQLAPDMAVGYEFADGRFVAQPFEHYHNIMPAGSGSSTANDMARFMIAHLQGGRSGNSRILKPETARLMHSNLSANASSLPGFAHGFYVVRENGPRMIGHGGNTADFHSMLLLAPEADFGIFVSYTGGGRGSGEARTDLINAVAGHLFPQAPAPRWTGAASLPPAGAYRTNRRTYSEPADPKNDIVVRAEGERGLSVEAAGKKTYWAQIGPRLYERVTGARPGGPFDRIEFHGDAADTRMSFASQPMVLYRLVQGPENIGVSLKSGGAPAADTPGKTQSGVSYTQPKGWAMTAKGAATIFTAPEANFNIAVVNSGNAAGAQAAAAKAWSIYKPDSARKVRLVTTGTPGEGWDERVSIAYETSPNERAVVSALALRKGDSWTVMIVDGAEATFGKRSAAASIIQQSLRPAGYERESFAGKTAHRLTPDRIRALRDFVEQSARTLEVPGVGVALIDQGKVVWQGGIGVRRLGSSEPVNEHTKFMIASNTKGMATLLLSVLADEGKLRWDQPVTELYPSFRLGSDATTRSTLVRHLVCACTGLPRKDYAFILAESGAQASDTFRQLAQTQPTSGFGELFQYNNLMASAAGYLGGALAYPNMELGAAFDKAMETRVFKPLGMRNTTFDFAIGERGNWARPHGLDAEGRMVEIPNDFNHLITPHRPAGGAWSTTADMARYAQLELSKGLTPEGKRLVSEANIVERRKRGVPVGEDSWYGMGLFERVAYGVPVVTHGGTLLGYHSTFYALPDSGIGAVILTNADPGAAMLGPFLRRLLEVVYDGKPEAAGEVAAAAARVKAQAKARRERLTIPGDPAVLASLASTYRSPEVGTVILSDRGGTKWMKAGFIEGPVATRKNADGSISLVSAGPGSIGVEALVGNQNGARTLTIRDSQHEYVYTEAR